MSFIINFFKNFIHNMLQLLSFSKRTITNSLRICVKSNTGHSVSVDLDPKWDIKDVKEFVAPQLGLQAEEMKIVSFIEAKIKKKDYSKRCSHMPHDTNVQ